MLPKGLLKEHSQALSLVLRGLDVLAIIISGLVAYYYKFNHLNLPAQYIFALLTGALVTWVVFSIANIYESARAKGFLKNIRNLIRTALTVIISLAVLAFLTKTGEDFSRAWFLIWSGVFLGFLILFRCGMIIFLRIMRQNGWNERHVVIIGAGELGAKLVDTVQHALWTGFHIKAIFDDDPAHASTSIRNIPILPTPKDIGAYIAENKNNIDEIWLALPLRAEDRVKEILHELRHETMTTRFILDIFGLDLLNHSIEDFAGFPMLNVRSTPMKGLNRAIKAFEDRVLSFLILVMISPLFASIALAVKCSSPGPVFYRQKRVGWNGEEFEMLKFRTMPVDIEKSTGPVWAKPNEQRATAIGAFLRKTSLDELPQFINVLRGEMSIVGPRPERLVFVEQFKEQIPRYMQKHLVKAGITGWAQVNGWRGNTSLEKRIEYDLYYIENWSFAFDLKIIFLTFFQGFLNKNAY